VQGGEVDVGVQGAHAPDVGLVGGPRDGDRAGWDELVLEPCVGAPKRMISTLV
jgi:hypothetical protein